MDRIDIHIEVPNIPKKILHETTKAKTETSEIVQLRISKAYQRQIERANKANHKMTNREVEKFCRLDDTGTQLLDTAISQLGLSARAMHRILKVARTIADLAESEQIENNHLSEAINYRRLDRSNTLLN